MRTPDVPQEAHEKLKQALWPFYQDWCAHGSDPLEQIAITLAPSGTGRAHVGVIRFADIDYGREEL